MSSTKVKGWVLLNCLEHQKEFWLKRRAEEHEKYRQVIMAGLRTKWWQFFRYRTFEEALMKHSKDYFGPVYRFKDSAPEIAEKDWNRQRGNIKLLAEHARNTGGEVELDESQSYLLTFFEAP